MAFKFSMAAMKPGELVQHIESQAIGIIIKRDKYANLIIKWLYPHKHLKWWGNQERNWFHLTNDIKTDYNRLLREVERGEEVGYGRCLTFIHPNPKELQVVTKSYS